MLSLIAAMDRNGVIGVNGVIPWKAPEDLLNFRRLTWNKRIVVGRKTYESIGNLPNRWSIILSRKILGDYIDFDRNTVVHDINEFFYFYGHYGLDEEVFVCGGKEIYKQFAKYIDRMYLTVINSAEQYSGEVVKFPWTSFAETRWATIEQRKLGDNFYYVYDQVKKKFFYTS